MKKYIKLLIGFVVLVALVAAIYFLWFAPSSALKGSLNRSDADVYKQKMHKFEPESFNPAVDQFTPETFKPKTGRFEPESFNLKQ